MDSVGGDNESGQRRDREPRMHIIADLSSEKFSLHLSQYSVELHIVWIHFADFALHLRTTTVQLKKMKFFLQEKKIIIIIIIIM